MIIIPGTPRRGTKRRELMDIGGYLIKEQLIYFVEHLKSLWGEELISVVLFGSWVANRAKRESDIDLPIVIRNFPKNRSKRFIDYYQIMAEEAWKN